jgi:hypothetical protein
MNEAFGFLVVDPCFCRSEEMRFAKLDGHQDRFGPLENVSATVIRLKAPALVHIAKSLGKCSEKTVDVAAMVDGLLAVDERPNQRVRPISPRIKHNGIHTLAINFVANFEQPAARRVGVERRNNRIKRNFTKQRVKPIGVVVMPD